MESSAFSKFVRGFNPDRFYFWYKLSRKSNNKILKTIATVKYMRIATKCGGYIGRETILHDMPILPHGFHGVHISRGAEIGKNVTINFFEAKLMQIIYKKKYSKANQENLQVSEEE